MPYEFRKQTNNWNVSTIDTLVFVTALSVDMDVYTIVVKKLLRIITIKHIFK